MDWGYDLRRQEKRLRNHCRDPIHPGGPGRINNTIRAIKRQAYDCRNDARVIPEIKGAFPRKAATGSAMNGK